MDSRLYISKMSFNSNSLSFKSQTCSKKKQKFPKDELPRNYIHEITKICYITSSSWKQILFRNNSRTTRITTAQDTWKLWGWRLYWPLEICIPKKSISGSQIFIFHVESIMPYYCTREWNCWRGDAWESGLVEKKRLSSL